MYTTPNDLERRRKPNCHHHQQQQQQQQQKEANRKTLLGRLRAHFWGFEHTQKRCERKLMRHAWKRQEALQYISCHISKTKNNFISEEGPKSAGGMNELCLEQTWHQQLETRLRAKALFVTGSGVEKLHAKINVRNFMTLYGKLCRPITYYTCRTRHHVSRFCVCVCEKESAPLLNTSDRSPMSAWKRLLLKMPITRRMAALSCCSSGFFSLEQ